MKLKHAALVFLSPLSMLAGGDEEVRQYEQIDKEFLQQVTIEQNARKQPVAVKQVVTSSPRFIVYPKYWGELPQPPQQIRTVVYTQPPPVPIRTVIYTPTPPVRIGTSTVVYYPQTVQIYSK